VSFDDTWIFRDCPWCGLHSAQFTTHAHIEAARRGKPARYWSVLTCPRCGSPVTLETRPPTEPAGVLKTIPDTAAVIDVAHLPPDVERYYRDAIRVLEAGVPDAAAVQLRRTLEAAAAHHEVKTGPLVQRIRKLIEAGLITADFAKVLDHIRVVGNAGAHASDTPVDEEAARRAFRFTTQVLRNLFEIPEELRAIDRLPEHEASEDATSSEQAPG
jgi:hypothetical protein